MQNALVKKRLIARPIHSRANNTKNENRKDLRVNPILKLYMQPKTRDEIVLKVNLKKKLFLNFVIDA